MADLASLVKRLETVAFRLEGIGNSDSRAVVSGKANYHISFNLVLSISIRSRRRLGYQSCLRISPEKLKESVTYKLY